MGPWPLRDWLLAGVILALVLLLAGVPAWIEWRDGEPPGGSVDVDPDE